ncbi:hypothetical protein V8C34DRAFT_295232 [Trichoderma compactum]
MAGCPRGRLTASSISPFVCTIVFLCFFLLLSSLYSKRSVSSGQGDGKRRSVSRRALHCWWGGNCVRIRTGIEGAPWLWRAMLVSAVLLVRSAGRI